MGGGRGSPPLLPSVWGRPCQNLLALPLMSLYGYVRDGFSLYWCLPAYSSLCVQARARPASPGLTGGILNAIHAPCSSCSAVCSSSCLFAVAPTLMISALQALVVTNKWILLVTFSFLHTRDSAKRASGALFSMSPAHCYISGHRGSDWVDLAMQRLFNFLSSEQLINIREEVRDHWSTLPSERTSFTPLHCSFRLWSQSRSSETFLSSCCVLQRWENLRVNCCPTTTSQNCRCGIWAAGSFLSTQLTYQGTPSQMERHQLQLALPIYLS